MEDNTFDRLDRKPIYYEKTALGNRMFLNDFAMQDTNAFYISEQYGDQKLAYSIKDETINNVGECFSQNSVQNMLFSHHPQIKQEISDLNENSVLKNAIQDEPKRRDPVFKII